MRTVLTTLFATVLFFSCSEPTQHLKSIKAHSSASEKEEADSSAFKLEAQTTEKVPDDSLTSYGTEFTITKAYTLYHCKLTNGQFWIFDNDDDSYGNTSIYLQNAVGDSIVEIMKDDANMLSMYDFTIEEIKNPNLKNIEKVIKIQIANCPCGCEITDRYWLVTKEEEWIELPALDNFSMQFREEEDVYAFHTENTIDLVRNHYEALNPMDENLDIRLVSSSVIKSYHWNGHAASDL